MPGFAGFDISGYPGDAAMNWLKANTNLVWCGYYMAAPSHLHSTWLGKRAQLSAAGWGIAPVFVGQQVIPPGSQNPSAATGVTDGNQAVTQMTNEGFAPGSCVYLDLENGPPLTNAQRDYVSNWCDTVQARRLYTGRLLQPFAGAAGQQSPAGLPHLGVQADKPAQPCPRSISQS
jgi:hypothetical protein